MPRTGTKELGLVRSHESHERQPGSCLGTVQGSVGWSGARGAGETFWPMVLRAWFQRTKVWGTLSPRIPDVCIRTKAVLCPNLLGVLIVSQNFGSPGVPCFPR